MKAIQFMDYHGKLGSQVDPSLLKEEYKNDKNLTINKIFPLKSKKITILNKGYNEYCIHSREMPNFQIIQKNEGYLENYKTVENPIPLVDDSSLKIHDRNLKQELLKFRKQIENKYNNSQINHNYSFPLNCEKKIKEQIQEEKNSVKQANCNINSICFKL